MEFQLRKVLAQLKGVGQGSGKKNSKAISSDKLSDAMPVIRQGFCDRCVTSMRETVLELLRERSYRLGNYTLSSGKESEHYVNCKPVTLNGEGLYLISNLLLDHVDKDTCAVAGLTLGADPLVSGVVMACHQQWRPLEGLIIRKKPKGHGTASQIEGNLPPEGSTITVLEDVTTTGQSALKAVYILRDAGYYVDRVVTIVDRQDYDTRAIMEHEGLDFFSLFTLSDLSNANEQSN